MRHHQKSAPEVIAAHLHEIRQAGTPEAALKLAERAIGGAQSLYAAGLITQGEVTAQMASIERTAEQRLMEISGIGGRLQ